MAKIKRLSHETINQIAAGEVIENPASVIKELVENSIDAGATRLFVEIENGGQSLIRIQDNGCGMNEEDLLLSIERHATSKLTSHEDLETLATMGFRGEALAAVASISHLTIRTAEKKSAAPVQSGHILQVEGSRVVSLTAADCVPGTDITVASLFYNVPARKKFQKAPSKDSFEVIKCLTQLALAHPDVEFELIANKKREFLLTEAGLKPRMKALLGQEFVSDLKEISFKKGGVEITGFIGSHTTSKPNRSGQWLFLNNRPIVSLPVSYAVKEAFGTALDKDRHPIFVLHLTIDGDSVDVNVHPQKKEVRFREEEQLRNHVREAVMRALFQRIPEILTPEISLPEPFAFPVPAQSAPAPQFFVESRLSDFEEPEFTQVVYATAPAPLTAHFDLPSFRIVGVYQEYIFADLMLDGKEGLFVVDAKAALLRVIFEDIAAKKPSSVPAQRLFTPFHLNVSLPDASAIEALIPSLQAIGFDIHPFGKATFLVEMIPAAMQLSDLDQFFKEVVQEDEEDAVKRQRKLARVASRHSFSKKQALSIDLAKELMRRLLSLEQHRKCPFGREIFAPLFHEELQKKFL